MCLSYLRIFVLELPAAFQLGRKEVVEAYIIHLATKYGLSVILGRLYILHCVCSSCRSSSSERIRYKIIVTSNLLQLSIFEWIDRIMVRVRRNLGFETTRNEMLTENVDSQLMATHRLNQLLYS